GARWPRGGARGAGRCRSARRGRPPGARPAPTARAARRPHLDAHVRPRVGVLSVSRGSRSGAVRAVVVSVHDVAPAPAGPAMRWRPLVAARTAGPVCLLVVPRHDGSRWDEGEGLEWLRARRAAGDEIALHGLTHRTPDGVDGPELRWRSAEDVHAR